MANEFEILPNPDNVPGAVTSGYQRQNTNIFTIQTGLDTTEPVDNGSGVITIPLGGIVEINGVLFKLTSNVTLQKPNANICYWIAINPNDDGKASASLVTRPGKWNPTKQGCYLQNGRRTLNWASLGTTTELAQEQIFSKTVKGTWEIQLARGWYYVKLASGLGNGNGGAGSAGAYNSGGMGGGGGVANTSDFFNKVFFSVGKTFDIRVGGNGENGSNGGNYSGNSYRGGGGGGGGSGGGERSSFDRFSTLDVRAGDGGNGGKGYSHYITTWGAGGIGGTWGKDGTAGNDFSDSEGYIFPTGRAGGTGIPYLGGGGGGGGGSGEMSNSYGGAGGNGGIFGFYRANGQPGGYCNIYKLEF